MIEQPLAPPKIDSPLGAEELAPLGPSHATPKVLAPAGRQHAAWLGGAILGSLPTMPSMWISKEEYDENGPLIVHRKTF